MIKGDHDGANFTWNHILKPDSRAANSTETAILAVLMDIREELRALTATVTERLDCIETLSMPGLLRRIAVNTRKSRRKARRK